MKSKGLKRAITIAFPDDPEAGELLIPQHPQSTAAPTGSAGSSVIFQALPYGRPSILAGLAVFLISPILGDDKPVQKR